MKTELDMSKEARASRYQEWLGLKSLPFKNREQGIRFMQLSRQRVKDNHFAFNENKKNAIQIP